MDTKTEVTAYSLAQRFVGLQEIPGQAASPIVLSMLQLDAKWVADDETPWCSAFVNAIAWLLDLPRSRSLAARSWLKVGVQVPLEQARVGFDVVVLTRGRSGASGHVGFYAGHSAGTISLLGGNQGNAVSVATFARTRLLDVRRLAPDTPNHVATRPA